MQHPDVERLKLLLQLMEFQFGNNHIEIVEHIIELADCYFSNTEYSKAEPYYWRALEIRSHHYGNEHPEVAEILGRLARLYNALNQFDYALQLHRWANRIEENDEGQEAQDVKVDILTALEGCDNESDKSDINLDGYDKSAIDGLRAVAIQCQRHGLIAESAKLYERALAKQLKVFGKHNIQVARSLADIASLYRKLEDAATAAEMERISHKIVQSVDLKDAAIEL